MKKERVPTRIFQFSFCCLAVVGFKASERNRSSLTAEFFDRGAPNARRPSSYNRNLPRKSI